jgi:hypothetical protein
LRKLTPNNIVLLCVATLLALVSCRKQELHLKRTNYTASNLRLDGYYYDDQNDSSQKTGRAFLYNNGIVFYLSGYSLNQNSEFVASLQDPVIVKSNRERRSNWGVFIVEGTNIKYETPSVSESGAPYVLEGSVLNDTTIYFTQYYELTKKGKKRKQSSTDITFRFVQFSPKPDSTNNFIP